MATNNTLTGIELVKELNSKRTQGEWMQFANKVATKTNSTLVDYDTTVFVNNQNLSERIENAQYAALAVNHFANVCDFIESIILELNYIDNNDLTDYERKLLKKAKQALNNIKL